MNKLFLAVGVIVIVVVGVVGFAAYSGIINLQPPAAAKLVVESGDVFAKKGTAEYEKVSGELQLSQGDSVKTGAGARAKIVFFDSSETRLDENTEVTVAKLVADKASRSIELRQESGKVWSRVSAATGLQEYNVDLGNTVATVRGTAFISTVNSTEETLDTRDGEVEYLLKKVGKKVKIPKGKWGRVDRNNPIDVIMGDSPQSEFADENLAKDEKLIAAVKEKITRKYAVFIPVLKQRYAQETGKELTDAQIDGYLDKFVRGDYDKNDPAIVQAIEQLKQAGVSVD